jgi:hypothetical protein
VVVSLVVPGFEDLVEIGRGGFAVVYSACQVAVGRDVAIKVIARPDLDDAERRRFEREARLAGRLSWHPHIVSVHDAGILESGTPYIVMELLPGGSLADRLATSGPLPWAEAVAAAIQLATALEVAHREGMLHRDVKPGNALVTRLGDVKLGDFGIAVAQGGTHTASGLVVATIAHAAPEVLTGGDVDERADLWSLGSTLYELLAGRPPFAGDADESPLATAYRAVNEPLPELHPDLAPPGVRALVHRCLAKHRDDRPASALELALELHACELAAGLPGTPLRVDDAPVGAIAGVDGVAAPVAAGGATAGAAIGIPAAAGASAPQPSGPTSEAGGTTRALVLRDDVVEGPAAFPSAGPAPAAPPAGPTGPTAASGPVPAGPPRAAGFAGAATAVVPPVAVGTRARTTDGSGPRRRWLLLAALVVGIGLAAVVAVMLVADDPDDRSRSGRDPTSTAATSTPSSTTTTAPGATVTTAAGAATPGSGGPGATATPDAEAVDDVTATDAPTTAATGTRPTPTTRAATSSTPTTAAPTTAPPTIDATTTDPPTTATPTTATPTTATPTTASPTTTEQSTTPPT